jgi:hypothetical protein
MTHAALKANMYRHKEVYMLVQKYSAFKSMLRMWFFWRIKKGEIHEYKFVRFRLE